MVKSVEPYAARRSIRRFRPALVLGLGLSLAVALEAPAVDVVTDGNMEAAGIAVWPHTDISGTNSSAKATDQFSSPVQSLKGTSQIGSRQNRGWYNAQTLGLINTGDTVLLSLWWGSRFNVSTSNASGDLFVDIKLTADSWANSTNVWTLALTPSTAFQSGTLTNLDISADITASGSWDVRLRFEGRTGRDANANIEIWWDDVIVDVTGAAASTTVGNGTDPATASLCPGGVATELDAFTLQTSSGVDTVSAVQVSFAAGTSAGIGLVEITSDDGATVYGSVTNPADTQNVSLTTNITANTTLTQYKVRITPKSHAAMAAPPGTTYAVTGTVTDITNTLTKNLNDTASATVTIDNQSPGNPTWNTITPGDTQIDLNWTDPGDADFADVVILRSTATIADIPAEGITYSAGNTIGASTVVFAGTGTNFTDTGVSNGTAYWYRIFARDNCGNYSSPGAQTGPHTPIAAGETTTVGDGTDPANASRCPGAGVADLDAFTLETSAGTDTVTALQVTFAAGTAVGLSLVEVTSDNGATVYGSASNPTDTQSITLTTPIGVTTTRTQYRLRVTPKSHAAMPVPPGATYAVTGTVTGITSTNSPVLSDTGSATVTIDNQSTANATWGAITPADGQVGLTWSNPADGDFSQVVILRNTASITDAPIEGVTYTAGNTIGASTVVFVGSGTSFTDTGVVNGTSYWYKIFARDTCGNYATGVQTGPHTPGVPALNSTTVTGTTAVVSSCRQLTSSSHFSDDANGNSSTLIEWGTSATGPWTTSCGTLTGASPRQCIVAQLAPGASYWLQATFTDSDGVTGPNPEVIGPFGVPSCGADEAAPTVLLLAPARNAVIGGIDRVKVQVFDEGGLAASNPVQWSVDGAAVSATGVTTNINYNCDVGCAVYEFDLDTTGLTNGPHYLTVQATDAASPVNTAQVNWAFRVNNQGTVAGGGGLLLRRTKGSQLCQDCHALPTHSSQATSTKYGNWAVECLSCHTPHQTRNVFLVRETLTTPNSGNHTVAFQFDDRTGETNPGDLPSDNPGRLGFLGDRSQTQSGVPNAPFDDGVCETCHTRTNHWRNSLSGGDHSHNAATRCLKCHAHDAGFKPAGGGDCIGCHGDTSQNGRRPVNPDFGQQSHHVGNGGNMGGAVSPFDCVVCHAEGTIDPGGATTTVPAFHGGDGGSKTIDLKNADLWDNANPSPAAVFSYDKAAVAASAGAAANWHSGNAAWRTETSTHLDPFCLTCHDTNGALSSFNSTDGGTATNPFGDAGITNNYDLKARGAVVDIKSKVFAQADLDGDGINDPPQGIYSRHAIRGQAFSRYQNYQAIAGGRTMYEGDATAGQSLFLQMGTDEFGKPLWNDTSLMGCADCHTVDGANGANGNAHGSPSEYLLKDAFGGSTEGTLGATSYICWRCHVPGRYNDPGVTTLGDHTGNSNDWQDKTHLTGTARITDGKGASIFAMACMNCHGGTNFGTIHGTSEVIGVGQSGGSGTRNAYRFMNGSSLRFYDPNGWTGTAVTCYTLGSADTWGGCTQHNRGQGFVKPLQRPLSY